jgi:hypothetical protein
MNGLISQNPQLRKNQGFTESIRIETVNSFSLDRIDLIAYFKIEFFLSEDIPMKLSILPALSLSRR